MLNVSPALRHIDDLDWTKEERYLEMEGGKEMCCWIDSREAPWRLRLANVRRENHPPIEKSGELSQLNLAAGGGLAELTHLVLFEDGICGAEFNFYAPRATMLPFYLGAKAPGMLPTFKLAALVRPDLEARLASMTDVTLLTLKARGSFEAAVAAADEELGAAFSASKRAFGAREEDEVTLSFNRKKNKRLLSRFVPTSLKEGVKRMAAREDLREQVSIFKVADRSGPPQSRMVDILQEQFISEREVEPATEGGGMVRKEAMFEAIESAYGEIRPQLLKATELG